MSAVEGYIPVNGSAGNSAPVGGRRRRASHKKLRLVKRKTVRKMLAAKGLAMRGGEGEGMAPEVKKEGMVEGMDGGRRRRRKSGRKTHRRRRSLFGY